MQSESNHPLYWSRKGDYQETYDRVFPEVPRRGNASNHGLECLRAVSNLYQDRFNNGWDGGVCNVCRVSEFLDADPYSFVDDWKAEDIISRIRRAYYDYEEYSEFNRSVVLDLDDVSDEDMDLLVDAICDRFATDEERMRAECRKTSRGGSDLPSLKNQIIFNNVLFLQPSKIRRSVHHVRSFAREDGSLSWYGLWRRRGETDVVVRIYSTCVNVLENKGNHSWGAIPRSIWAHKERGVVS